jgi:hypothetical protein
VIKNVYSTIIESAKVAYHWKTGQKPTFLLTTYPKRKFDAPNESFFEPNPLPLVECFMVYALLVSGRMALPTILCCVAFIFDVPYPLRHLGGITLF